MMRSPVADSRSEPANESHPYSTTYDDLPVPSSIASGTPILSFNLLL
jgi:hypothetical protein